MNVLFMLKKRSVQTVGLFCALFFGLLLANNVSAQNPWWLMPPYLMHSGNPLFAAQILPPAAGFNGAWGTNPVADGVFNSSTGKGFYIQNSNLHDLFAGNQIGSFTVPISLSFHYIVPEMQVIKVPGLCETYYVVFKEYLTDVVRYGVVAWDDNVGAYQVIADHTLPTLSFQGYLGMATSRIKPSTGKRNLYICVSHYAGNNNGLLYRFEVDATGINLVSTNILSGVYNSTFELELNEAEDKLAWGNLGQNGSDPEVYVLSGLGASGSVPFGNINLGSPNLEKFVVNTGSSPVNGLEFSGEKLYFSTGDPTGPTNLEGIYVIDLNNGGINLIPNSTPFAKSQIETGFDKQLYVGTEEVTGTYTLQGIDVNTDMLDPSLVIQGLENFPKEVILGHKILFLPDPIDNETYIPSNGVWADAGPDLSRCSGACVNLGLTICAEPTDNITYTWERSGNGGASWIPLTPAGTYNSPTISVQVYGTTLFRVTATEPYNGGTITATDEAYVFINPWCYSICIGGGGGGDDASKNQSLSAVNEFAFKAYPNPAQSGNGVTLEIQNPSAGEVEVALMNLQGQVIRNRNIPLPEGASEIELSTEQLAAGLYTLRIEYEGAAYYQKLVIQ